MVLALFVLVAIAVVISGSGFSSNVLGEDTIQELTPNRLESSNSDAAKYKSPQRGLKSCLG